MPRIFWAMNSHHSALAASVEEQVGVVAAELREAGAVPHLLEERPPLRPRSRRRRPDRAAGWRKPATDVFSTSRIASNPARSCACSSGVIGALFSGVHQLALRWYTVREATSSAIDGDDLHAARSGADDGHALAGEVDRRRRPEARVVRLAPEVLAARDVREVRHREDAGCGDEESCPELRAVARSPTAHVPDELVIGRRRDPGVESDVAPEVEPVDHVVQVALGLRLLGEVLLPLPFVEQLLREQVGVGVALRVEPGPGVAVPVPRPAHATARLDQLRGEARFTGAVELVDAGDAGADDQHVGIGRALMRTLGRVRGAFVMEPRICLGHRVIRGSVPSGAPTRYCTDRLVYCRRTEGDWASMAIVDQKWSALPVPYAMEVPDRVPKERYFDPGLLPDGGRAALAAGLADGMPARGDPPGAVTSSSTRSSTSRSSCCATTTWGCAPSRTPAGTAASGSSRGAGS